MNKRITGGRRKSDWLIPLGFLAVGVVAAFWASYNRTQRSDLLRQNEALKIQVQLLERVVEHYESDEGKSMGPGIPDSPPTPAATSRTPASAPVSNGKTGTSPERPAAAR